MLLTCRLTAELPLLDCRMNFSAGAVCSHRKQTEVPALPWQHMHVLHIRYDSELVKATLPKVGHPGASAKPSVWKGSRTTSPKTSFILFETSLLTRMDKYNQNAATQ